MLLNDGHNKKYFLRNIFNTKIKKSNTLCLFCHHLIVHQQQTPNKQWTEQRKYIWILFTKKTRSTQDRAAVFGKQQKCFNYFCMGAYVPSLYLGINCTFYKPSKIYTFHFLLHWFHVLKLYIISLRNAHQIGLQ